MSNDYLCQNHNRLKFKGFCTRFRFAEEVGPLGFFRKERTHGNRKDHEKATHLNFVKIILDRF